MSCCSITPLKSPPTTEDVTSLIPSSKLPSSSSPSSSDEYDSFIWWSTAVINSSLIASTCLCLSGHVNTNVAKTTTIISIVISFFISLGFRVLSAKLQTKILIAKNQAKKAHSRRVSPIMPGTPSPVAFEDCELSAFTILLVIIANYAHSPYSTRLSFKTSYLVLFLWLVVIIQ